MLRAKGFYIKWSGEIRSINVHLNDERVSDKIETTHFKRSTHFDLIVLSLARSIRKDLLFLFVPFLK